MNLIYHLLCRYQFSVKGQLSNEMIILNGKVNCKIRMVEIQSNFINKYGKFNIN